MEKLLFRLLFLLVVTIPAAYFLRPYYHKINNHMRTKSCRFDSDDFDSALLYRLYKPPTKKIQYTHRCICYGKCIRYVNSTEHEMPLMDAEYLPINYGKWVEPDTRDSVIDFVRETSTLTEVSPNIVIKWLDLATSKYYDWKKRYGRENRHNGLIPRDWWLLES